MFWVIWVPSQRNTFILICNLGIYSISGGGWVRCGWVLERGGGGRGIVRRPKIPKIQKTCIEIKVFRCGETKITKRYKMKMRSLNIDKQKPYFIFVLWVI